jgi:bacteriocin-like protein
MTNNSTKLNSLEVEYQELSDNELETVVGGTLKRRSYGYGGGGYGGGVIINNNNNNNNNH